MGQIDLRKQWMDIPKYDSIGEWPNCVANAISVKSWIEGYIAGVNNEFDVEEAKRWIAVLEQFVAVRK